MAPAVLIEVPSAANGRDDVVVGQDHLKDMRNELEALPGEPDKENAVGRHANGSGGSSPAVSANEDDPFDSDDSDEDEDEDDEFMPRGGCDRTTGARPNQNQFVATRARDNRVNNAPTEAAPPGVPSEAASRERERGGEGESGRTAQLIASRGTSVPQGE